MIWALCRGTSCPLTLQPWGMPPCACWQMCLSWADFPVVGQLVTPSFYPPTHYTHTHTHTHTHTSTSAYIPSPVLPGGMVPPLLLQPVLLSPPSQSLPVSGDNHKLAPVSPPSPMIDTNSHLSAPPPRVEDGSMVLLGTVEKGGQCVYLFINKGLANLSRLIEHKGEGTGVKHWQLRGVCASQCSSHGTCIEYISVTFLLIFCKGQVQNVYNSS